jgi:hypothetical protein
LVEDSIPCGEFLARLYVKGLEKSRLPLALFHVQGYDVGASFFSELMTRYVLALHRGYQSQSRVDIQAGLTSLILRLKAPERSDQFICDDLKILQLTLGLLGFECFIDDEVFGVGDREFKPNSGCDDRFSAGFVALKTHYSSTTRCDSWCRVYQLQCDDFDISYGHSYLSWDSAISL